MTDVTISIPAAALQQLADAAAAEGMSLQSYLKYLARKAMTPEERAAEAARTREILREWTGYDPTPEEAELDAELERWFAEARNRQ